MIRRKRTRTYEPSQKPPRWLKPLNAAFLLMRRFGGMSTLHVLTVTGRRTGRPRSTPVTVVTVDDKRYLLEGFPGADWAANVRAANGYAQLSVGGRIEHVDLIELDPTDAVVLRHWPQQAATGARIMRDADAHKSSVQNDRDYQIVVLDAATADPDPATHAFLSATIFPATRS
jgi:deazaflavin-dependent oxidoreductase (nitroreductase family)